MPLDNIQTEPVTKEMLESIPVYAGFWTRFAAFMADGLVLIIPTAVSMMLSAVVIPLLPPSSKDASISMMIFPMLMIVYSPPIAVWALYFSLYESGSQSATIGQRWVGIKVLDVKGNRISKARALSRYVLHFLSIITFGIGFLIQPFTSKKQALHDLISETIVVDINKRRGTAAIVKKIATILIPLFIFGWLVYLPIQSFKDYQFKAKFSKVNAIVSPIQLGVAMYAQEHGGSLNLHTQNNWRELGLDNPPSQAAGLNGIYLSKAGVIMAEVAPGVVSSTSCHVSFTPAVAEDLSRLNWVVATNCPSPVPKQLGAAQMGDDDAKRISQLIAKGANEKHIESPTNKVGVSTLFQAAIVGDIEKAKVLISRGANVNARDKEGTTPLFYALESGKMDFATMLIDKGADVNASVPGWDTPLIDAVVRKNTAIAKLLILKGADVNARDAEGETALHHAVNNGDKNITELLINNGANLNVKDGIGNTALFLSIRGEHNQISKLLLAKGADVNLVNKDGDGPLHCAAYHGNIEIIKLLLDKGANPYAKDKDGDTPLETAKEQKQNNTIKFLLGKMSSK
jgi:ankyrin repeat protein/uncharacterized RDD family membrane protein YckC